MLNVLLHSGYLTCTTLLLASAIQLWQGRRRVRMRLHELEELRIRALNRQQRMIELSRLNAAHQFEVRWLMALADLENVPRQIFSLLEKSPGETPRPAWFINSAGDVLYCNAAARPFCESMVFSHQGLSRLQAGTDRLLFQLHHDYHLIPGMSEQQRSRLQLFPCDENLPEQMYLCLPATPAITGDEDIDQALLSRLCRQIPALPLDERHTSARVSENEFDLIRNMLTLRTLTDEEFESPRVMLEEFLSRLAELTGFERASVYRHGGGELSLLELLAAGGVSVSSDDDLAWADQERVWLKKQTSAAEEFSWKTIGIDNEPAASVELCTVLIAFDKLATGSQLPDRTCLILSSRKAVLHSKLKVELACWSAQFLPQSFRKAIQRIQTEERARRDCLTRLANRHTFDTELTRSLAFCNHQQLPCSLLMLDLDHFKSINDQHGHLVGDAVLQAVSATISRVVDQMRVADRLLAARYGGEEFAILLPEISLIGAQRIAEQIRHAIELQGYFSNGEQLEITASIGVACSLDHGSTPERLIQTADDALYTAKHAGRNCVRTSPGQSMLPAVQIGAP